MRALKMEICFQVKWYGDYTGDSPGGLDGKESVCDAEDLVWSLCQEDPLEKKVATNSCIIAWRIPWTEELGCL